MIFDWPISSVAYSWAIYCGYWWRPTTVLRAINHQSRGEDASCKAVSVVGKIEEKKQQQRMCFSAGSEETNTRLGARDGRVEVSEGQPVLVSGLLSIIIVVYSNGSNI